MVTSKKTVAQQEQQKQQQQQLKPTPHSSSTSSPPPPLPFRLEPVRLGYFNNALILTMVDIPIYFLGKLTSRHFFVAGGGGKANTGVINQINLFEIVPTKDSCAAELTLKYRTPPEVEDAIMNASLMEDVHQGTPVVDNRLVTAGSPPYLYSIAFDVYKQSFAVTGYERFRPDKIQSEIKCVKCTIGRLFTGSVDGKLTVWSTLNLKREPFCQTQAHGKEIDEIDVEPNLDRVVTLCRKENTCIVWDIGFLKSIQKFDKTHINEQSNPAVSRAPRYEYRSCRFSYSKLPCAKNRSYFLTICNPNSTKLSSKLFKYETGTLKWLASANVSDDAIMSVNVSPDGLYVGLGTCDGSVLVYNVDSLNRVYKVNSAHSHIVTQIEFLTPDPKTLLLTNSHKFSLLSASLDRRIVLHRPKQTLGGYVIPISLIFIILNCVVGFFKFLYIN